MRTKIVIDAAVMAKTAQAASLKPLLKLRQQGEVRKLRGQLNWQGDLDAQRLDE